MFIHKKLPYLHAQIALLLCTATTHTTKQYIKFDHHPDYPEMLIFLKAGQGYVGCLKLVTTTNGTVKLIAEKRDAHGNFKQNVGEEVLTIKDKHVAAKFDGGSNKPLLFCIRCLQKTIKHKRHKRHKNHTAHGKNEEYVEVDCNTVVKIDALNSRTGQEHVETGYGNLNMKA
jgi:hypothetical protein